LLSPGNIWILRTRVLSGLLKGLVVLVLLAVATVAGGLTWMHLEVQQARSPLPLVADLLAVADATDLPKKISVIETARQVMPRAGVLDPRVDPRPDAPYVMTHPSFVVEWADGRLLLVDAGMSLTAAVDFGHTIERFAGGQPIEPRASVVTALGAAATRVKGIVFTHLHVDHVDGLTELCHRLGTPVKVFMTGAQLDSWTFFTAPGKRIVAEAGCADRVRIGGPPPLVPLEGFPGVGLIAAAGHTPGSQAIVAAVRDDAGTVRRFVFAGDITNTIDGVRGDIPKPLLYRLVLVPEDDDRLGELRRYFRALEKEQGFTIVPSHDRNHLATTGIPAWGS
jgi:glyoxylase-like metal-dependent hydrolase (beta-lactamase superfamily II)